LSDKELKDVGMGDLNPSETPMTRRELTSDTKYNRFAIDAAFESFGHNIFANAGPYKAIVLRSWQESDPSPSNFWNIFGDGLGGQMTMVKARIPEVHHYPIPDSLDPAAGPHQPIIELYPTYVSRELNAPPPAAGTIVWVDYEDRTNFKYPIYLGPVKADFLSKLSSEMSFVTSMMDSAKNLWNKASNSVSGFPLLPGQIPTGPWATKPQWRRTKVGLPNTVRPPGPRGSAGRLILAAAHELGLGDDFVTTMYTLAQNETKQRLGLPALSYHNPPGGRRISAWGTYQWQDRHVKKYFGIEYAYQMSYEQEIKGVMPTYAQKFKALQQYGNGPMGILTWHASPGVYYRLKRAGTTSTKNIQGHTKGASGRSWKEIVEGYMKKYYARRPQALTAYNQYKSAGAPSFEKVLQEYLSSTGGLV